MKNFQMKESTEYSDTEGKEGKKEGRKQRRKEGKKGRKRKQKEKAGAQSGITRKRRQNIAGRDTTKEPCPFNVPDFTRT